MLPAILPEFVDYPQPLHALDIHRYLAQLPVEKVWGIGPQTSALLAKHRIYTALEYATQPEA
jgi:nucleotidyltransferase/DNA polymerase involved in DNA repair